MTAEKVLDMAQRQGLLDSKVIAELRKQVAESKFVVTPEAIAKILVDHGHLTAFQARKLVAAALEEEGTAQTTASPAPVAAAPSKPMVTRQASDSDLGLADEPAPAKPAAAGPPKPLAQPIDLLEELPDAPPPAKPAGPKPPPFKGAPPKPPAAKPPAARPPARPTEELTELEEAAPSSPKPAPPKPAKKRKSPPEPPATLTPLPDLTPLNAPSGLSPIEDLGGGLTPMDPLGVDAMGGGLTPLGQPVGAQVPSARKKQVNPWQNSTYILIVGGAIGVTLVVGGLLLMNMFRGTASELATKADQEYEKGSLGSAIGLYDQFLKTYPDAPEAGKARVRRGMAELRQVSGEGKNARLGLTAAQRILPEIEKEPEFGDVRLELRTVLVDIAHSFATQAQAVKETAKKEELVISTEDALKLVNNAAYIPTSLKGDVQPRINEVLDRLKAARRSIDQDKDLAKALTEIDAAKAKSDAAAAYQIQRNLLKTYPALEGNPQLLEATLAIGAMEQKQIAVQAKELQPTTDDPPPVGARIVLGVHSGEAPALAGHTFVVLVRGSLFGLEGNSGKVAWRRYIGFESEFHPVPISRQTGSDYLVADARKHEVLRLKSNTGKVIWRLALGKPFAAPIVTADRVYVTTTDGQVIEIDVATGKSTRQVTLPQKPTVGVAVDATGGRILQVGEHSSLFALQANSLESTETFYTGHKSGAILIPPLVALDHVFVTESPADDYSLVHVLARAADGKSYARLPESFRVKGRVVVPLQMDRNRVIVVTDLGQVSVLQVDPGNKDKPVRLIGSSDALEKSAVISWFAVDKGRIYLTGRRCTSYEIQAAQQKLGRNWTIAADETFLAPPQIHDNVVVHVRRRVGSLATTVEAADVKDGRPLWTAEIAAPVVAVAGSDTRKQAVAINSRGRVYELTSEAIAAGYADNPVFVPLPGTEMMSLTENIDLGNGTFACLGPASGGQMLLYNNQGEAPRSKQLEIKLTSNDPTAAATLFRGGIVVPLQSGQVKLVNPADGGDLALPFQPALEAGARINWLRPAVLTADGSVLAISDGSKTIYRLTIQPTPQPHLESLGETVVQADLVGSLSVAGDTLYGVSRTSGGDALVSFSGPNLLPGEPQSLEGRITFGPLAAGGLVFVADDKKLLACETGGKVRWTQPLTHGMLSATPIPLEQDFLIITRSGSVYRIAGDSGQEIALVETGEPLTGVTGKIGPRLLVAGSDGVIHAIPIPAKP